MVIGTGAMDDLGQLRLKLEGALIPNHQVEPFGGPLVCIQFRRTQRPRPRQPSRFLPAFFAAAHRFFADNASRFRAATLIGFLLPLRRIGAATSGAAGPPSLCLSSLILRVISRNL